MSHYEDIDKMAKTLQSLIDGAMRDGRSHRELFRAIDDFARTLPSRESAIIRNAAEYYVGTEDDWKDRCVRAGYALAGYMGYQFI